MKKVSDSMQPILDTICPPKKTIWVLLWKDSVDDGEIGRLDSFWFIKPTVEQILERLANKAVVKATVLLQGKKLYIGSEVLQLREIAEGEEL